GHQGELVERYDLHLRNRHIHAMIHHGRQGGHRIACADIADLMQRAEGGLVKLGDCCIHRYPFIPPAFSEQLCRFFRVSAFDRPQSDQILVVFTGTVFRLARRKEEEGKAAGKPDPTKEFSFDTRYFYWLSTQPSSSPGE